MRSASELTKSLEAFENFLSFLTLALEMEPLLFAKPFVSERMAAEMLLIVCELVIDES